MSTTVTLQDVNNMMNDALAARGTDYIYPAVIDEWGGRSCRYWHPETDSPGCIVGFVFHRLGASRETLGGRENQSADAVIGALLAIGWQFPQFKRT